MSLPWFRFYHEFATDPKVQMLPEHYQRRYVMLLCIRCCNGDVTLHDEEIAFQLRIGATDWDETKAALVSKNMITKDNKIVNWDKRQFTSDTSTERVRAYRNKKKQLPKRKCNVSVTPPDTDTDTDTDIKKTKVKKIVTLEELSVDHIRDWLAKKQSEGRYVGYDPHLVLEKFKQYCKANGREHGKRKYDNFIQALRNCFDWDSTRKLFERVSAGGDKYQRSLEAATRGHMRAENPDF